MEELGKALIADCAAICNDPQYQRSSHVRNLRASLRQWAQEVKRLKKVDAELASAIHACARLEQNLNGGTDLDAYKCNQDQIASLHQAADSILAVEESRSFTAERNKAALDASFLLFGSKGVLPRPDQLGIPPVGSKRNDGKPLVKTWTDGWQPRWPGDIGDPFEPYQQMIEQHLHGAIAYHAKALEHFSVAFTTVEKARKNARDAAYLRTLAAAAGISVKEYQRLLEMFRRIDYENTGTISKKDLMSAMKRDKDILSASYLRRDVLAPVPVLARPFHFSMKVNMGLLIEDFRRAHARQIAAFMQLSRAKGKDGRRESFESVFNRIDNQGLGVVTWEAFLTFFSSERSILGSEATIPPPPIMAKPTMLPL